MSDEETPERYDTTGTRWEGKTPDEILEQFAKEMGGRVALVEMDQPYAHYDFRVSPPFGTWNRRRMAHDLEAAHAKKKGRS